MKKVKDDFLLGCLWVCQFLAISHGEETLAEFAMKESGYLEADFLEVQKQTEFETRRMNKVIHCAFKDS